MKTLAILVCLTAVSADAFAQSAIAGAVSDSWGEPLPGVAVEAIGSLLKITAELDW